MSNRDRVLEFLKSAGPIGATNADIVSGTGISPHQQVFRITRTLAREGAIKAIQSGKDWRFWPTETKITESERPKRAAEIYISENATSHAWNEQETINLRLGMDWIPAGRVTTTETGKLVFPLVPSTPGIYRLRIRGKAGEALYVGETENLSRRFGNYRNPGPTQQTSLRINAKLRAELEAGAEVGVATSTAGAWIERLSRRELANLSMKSVRCLFENAAILAGHALEIESLNR